MGTLSQMTEALKALTLKVKKIGRETQSLLQESDVPPETEQALLDLAVEIEKVDNMVPDLQDHIEHHL